MATQAVIFANTISGMKKAVKRKAYDSDSDSSIEQPTNRGNKLLKKARFVREGQLAPPSGPLVYKKSVIHAGFQRDIISRNPLLIDEYGYEFDSEDDDDQLEEVMAAAADANPYSRISIEQLLAPLTSAADLPNHPTLSKPFTSQTLTDLTRQAGEMVHKEKESLWKIKHLLTKLSGDNTWIPCGIIEDDNDFELFLSERDRNRNNILARVAPTTNLQRGFTPILMTDSHEQPVGLLTTEVRTTDTSKGADTQVVQMVVEQKDNATLATGILKASTSTDNKLAISSHETATTAASTETSLVEEHTNGITPSEDAQHADDQPQATDEDGADDESGVPVPRRMRTRAQAQAASDNTPTQTRSTTPDSVGESFIHPYFLASRSSRPDRDLNLPSSEADECRRLLQLYIQKQEEVCRGAHKVYEGLLRAERHRHEVFKWCKAEAHIGLNRDMSDGEDWYDKDEWGLDDDLKKGQDEEEEDTNATTNTKKTRARRQ